MNMKHFIMEGFCDGDKERNTYPCNGTLKFGVHCWECSKFSYTYCPNEIAISNAEGVVENSVGFGGEMEPAKFEKRKEYIEIWNGICEKKINEAYNEFMEQIGKKNK